MEVKVAMVIINKRGKRPSHRCSEEQVVQTVEYIAKIVIANAENDESTIVDNDLESEIPSMEV